MPVRYLPFSRTKPGDIARPYLPVTVVNPAGDQHLNVMALIDTGADECAMPAAFARLLGHNLARGKSRTISTGNGVTTAYAHTARIIIEGFSTQDVLIDFMPHLKTPLLGVRSFLGHFRLVVDYPRRRFSLHLPR